MKTQLNKILSTIAISIALTSCATTNTDNSPPVDSSQVVVQKQVDKYNDVAGTKQKLNTTEQKHDQDPNDPYENYNRWMFDFNHDVYSWLTPITKVYDYIVPDAIKTGIFNVFNNLSEPARIINDMFQGQWSYAGDDSVRFLTNTTIGIAGIFDVAKHWGYDMRYYQSFAVTMRYWGWEDNTTYFILPILGPSSTDGIIGMGVDSLFNPLTYTTFIPGLGPAITYGATSGFTGTYYFNQGVVFMPEYNNMYEVSIDPYVAMKNIYIQNHEYNIMKILGKEVANDKGKLEQDAEVLNILGLNDEDMTTDTIDNQFKKDVDINFSSSLNSINSEISTESKVNKDKAKDTQLGNFADDLQKDEEEINNL